MRMPRPIPLVGVIGARAAQIGGCGLCGCLRTTLADGQEALLSVDGLWKRAASGGELQAGGAAGRCSEMSPPGAETAFHG